ncbi:MAG TPA: alpha/beta fold hydrolase [Ilumatobacter sp.]|nr:alpha/beta fold hydrolase [Ilumatobacter sp.]
MDDSFPSGGFKLACHVQVPSTPVAHDQPALILCHGFPIGPLDARRSAGTFPELVDRIAFEVGYPAMTFNFRGTGTSTGDFSLQGWVEDLRAAIDHLLRRAGVGSVVLVGTNTGGSLAVCVAADDPRVVAAALLSPRADFDDWAEHPRRFLEHAREIGAIRTPGYPRSLDEWSRAFRRFRPVTAAQRFAPRPMLVMHGEDDDSVPTSDARQLAGAHGSAELSLLPGAGHRLRHDPRAIAILLGWLDRVRPGD